MVVTLSHEGYAKTQPVSDYQAQNRGGKGKTASKVKDEDFIEKLVIASTHDTILCFSNYGKVYWLKTYHIPVASRTARGRPIVNILPLQPDEKINAILPVREFAEDKYVFLSTSNGTVKKVSLEQFSRPRSNGIIAVELVDGDKLIGAALTDGSQDVLLFSDAGKAIRFKEIDVRPTGRTARGVRGIKLQKDQKVISLVIANDHGAILTATENGYGKRTAMDEYRLIGRGGQGVISIQISERNGKVVGAIQVKDEDEIMLISDGGMLVRIPAEQISVIGRNTQGVRLVNLSNEEKLIGVERVEES
jgi:DNA gyrase subunit A